MTKAAHGTVARVACGDDGKAGDGGEGGIDHIGQGRATEKEIDVLPEEVDKSSAVLVRGVWHVLCVGLPCWLRSVLCIRLVLHVLFVKLPCWLQRVLVS